MQGDREGAGVLSTRPQLASPPMVSRRVLLISGSLRRGSTNTALLQTAVAVAPDDVDAVLYAGLATLPPSTPTTTSNPSTPTVADLRAAVGAADAVLFSTPEYAGALPGSFKNLLDWTVGGGEIYEKPVAWVNPSTALNARGRRARVAANRVAVCRTRSIIDGSVCEHPCRATRHR